MLTESDRQALAEFAAALESFAVVARNFPVRGPNPLTKPRQLSSFTARDAEGNVTHSPEREVLYGDTIAFLEHAERIAKHASRARELLALAQER